MSKPQQPWYLYIIENRFGHWYTGITNDVSRRFSEHVAGKGAKNLRGKGPLKLVYSLAVEDKRTAARLEWRFKRLSKSRKVALVQGAADTDNADIKALICSDT
ncbi:GIY-YIG nuclease family protein [Pseudoalteromonas rubra]|uniref:GIY-YIG nuclease family protein n=1 Tax=Pseudoalteromonas rubra TaxID=43658 RepID=UPI00026CB674|nr:GIY-YIG nuclease family protein [Pseudoalteromonas rubra]